MLWIAEFVCSFAMTILISNFIRKSNRICWMLIRLFWSIFCVLLKSSIASVSTDCVNPSAFLFIYPYLSIYNCIFRKEKKSLTKSGFLLLKANGTISFYHKYEIELVFKSLGIWELTSVCMCLWVRVCLGGRGRICVLVKKSRPKRKSVNQTTEKERRKFSQLSFHFENMSKFCLHKTSHQWFLFRNIYATKYHWLLL